MHGARLLLRLTFAALLASLCLDPARAEIRVQGDVGAIRLQADDATVEDVLAMLHTRFGLVYRSSSALTRRVTATFQGPLLRVVGRVLDGYDFVIKTHGASLEVIVLGAGLPREASPAPIVRRRVD
jgi:hypothetical protein